MAAVSPSVNITTGDNGILMDPHSTQLCLSRALFLHALPEDSYVIFPVFLALVSGLLTLSLRFLAGVMSSPEAAKPTARDVESTAIPDPANTQVDVEAGLGQHESPPPYAPPNPNPVSPSATTTSAPETPALPEIKQTSAALFVEGTAVLIPMIFSIMCLALSINWMSFCREGGPESTMNQAISWLLLFFPPAIWAINGVSCWAMLFRNLWGPAAKKKYDFGEDAVLIRIWFMISGPFIVTGWVLTAAITAAQKTLCGNVIADEEEVIGDLRRTDEIALDSRMVTVGEEEGEASESNAQRQEECSIDKRYWMLT